MSDHPIPEICDYEGSDYHTRFWEGKGRDYEDRAERIAIRRLLPPSGRRIIDIGGAYGRLVPLYRRYEQIILFDYSRSQLEEARRTYGDDGFLYVAGNVYQMPFAPGVFDAALMVRVLHHMADAPAALRQVRTTLQHDGVFLLEFANKRNLKAIARWLLRRQSWNPFDREPVEFAALNFDFHPRMVRETLRGVGFEPGRTLTVSHLRAGFLKHLIPTAILVFFDSLAQFTGGLWQLTPSVFVRNTAVSPDTPIPEGAFWRCPSCGSLAMRETGGIVACDNGHRWGIVNGIYDFKEPLA
jgi:SAM-dependent methyltransferase